MNWTTWFKALGVAAATGAIAGAGHGFGVKDPKPSSVGLTAAAGALVGALGYLAQASDKTKIEK